MAKSTKEIAWDALYAKVCADSKEPGNFIASSIKTTMDEYLEEVKRQQPAMTVMGNVKDGKI